MAKNIRQNWGLLNDVEEVYLDFYGGSYNCSPIKNMEFRPISTSAQPCNLHYFSSLVSIGAVIVITGSYFGLNWLDPLTAVIVGFIICLTAWDIFKETVHDLTDGFEVNKLNEIENTINTTPGVKFVKDIKGRLSGNQQMVDAIIFVEPTLTVIQSHEISENVERRLSEIHNINHAHIHIEPY